METSEKESKKDILDTEDKSVTIKEKLLLLFWKVFRIFCYRTVYFFDTNMIVADTKLDSRLIKLFTLNRKFFINNHIKEEVEILLGNRKYRRILKYQLKVISYDDLRSIDPSICPLYYNFISAMHNPAVVWSLNFFMEASFAEMMNKRDMSEKEKKAYIESHLKVIKQFMDQTEQQKKSMEKTNC